MPTLIVLDGLDGCGKHTQTSILKLRLKDVGYNVESISFPDYESLSSGPVRMYLGGELGNDPENISPYLCGEFYAVDRAAQFYSDWHKKYTGDTVIISDRYISANLLYQGAKFSTDDEAKEFFKWMYELEVNKNGIPKEDITIALTLPISTSQKLMLKRYNGSAAMMDIHEKNIGFLEKASRTLDLACDYLPTIGYNWVRLDCSDDNGDVLPMGDISEKIFNLAIKTIEHKI